MRFLILISCFLTISCDFNAQQSISKVVLNGNNKIVETKHNNVLAEAFYHKTPDMAKKVNSIYDSLSTEERAAQIIMIASSEKLGFPYKTYVKPLVDKGVAANIIYLKGTSTEFLAQDEYLSTKLSAGLLPLNACDCEPSLMHYKFTDQPKMLSTDKLADSTKLATSLDSIITIMKKNNIGVNFAPVVDFGKNKDVINNRSFGNNSDTVFKYSNLFINHTQNNNISTAIKHFPGHGNVTGDTHKQKVWIDGEMKELNTFKNIIHNTHPIFTMVGHISIKNNKEGYNTPNGNPASISRNIVTDLLMNEIGFKGIKTTDAMNMGAIKNIPNADFEAVKAGIDLVLMPNNPERVHQQIVAALNKNDELSKQIEVSIKKIILLKLISGRYQVN